METTRHFTATTYVVEGGAVALHEHHRIGRWLPPGGHVDRDELPHVSAKREVREELGFDVDLVASQDDIGSETATSLPQPQHFLLTDVNVTEQGVGHQHVDLIYYARAPTRAIDPEPGEQPAEDWQWFDRTDLGEREDLDADVAEIGRRAIETISGD